MSGKIVNCTNLDSVRIEVLGEGRALTIPASLLLAADMVLRRTFCQRDGFVIDHIGEEGKPDRWIAGIDGTDERGHGESPWQAVFNLAERIGQ